MRKLVLALGILLLAASNLAAAERFPNRPITMVVPFGAGGPTDVIARVLADRMGAALGQTVVVENVTGAAGTIGVGRVARAAADGYTIGIGHYGTHAVNSLIYALQYDVLNDFEPIALVSTSPYLFVTRDGVPASNLRQLIEWLRTKPDKASVSTGGVGAAGHLIGLKLQGATGARLQFIPYRGGAGPAMQDMLGGTIDLSFSQPADALALVKEGRIRAYAVTAKARLAAAPKIPTVDEAGLPGFYVSVWHGLWAPKGTPRAVIAKLQSAVVSALADRGVRQRLGQLGQEIPSRAEQTSEALAARQRAEIDIWAPIVKTAHIQMKSQ